MAEWPSSETPRLQLHQAEGCPKADPHKQGAFGEACEILKENLGDIEKIYFADAAHPVHNAVAKDLKKNSARNRLNLNGTIDPVSLEVVMLHAESITSKAVISFLAEH